MKFSQPNLACTAALVLSIVCAAAAAQEAAPVPETLQLNYGPDIGQKCAGVALAAAEEHAIANNWLVSIAIVDTGGGIVGLSRMDNAHKASVDFAIAKASSAAMTKRSTKVFSDALADGRTAILGFMDLHVHAAEGGEVLLVADEIVGGIGAAGATQEQDRAIANAGVAAVQGCNAAQLRRIYVTSLSDRSASAVVEYPAVVSQVL